MRCPPVSLADGHADVHAEQELQTAAPSAAARAETVGASAARLAAAGASLTYQVPVAFDSTMTSASIANTATVSDTNIPNSAQSATDTDTLAASADLSITKTDGVTSATPGGSVTYTIVASNAGPSAVTGATVADTFAAAFTSESWTCVGAGGGTCTASGSGNINDTVNLPVGASITYTVSTTISASATGSLINTATVTAPAGVTDPTPGNNSATDIDALGASADVSNPRNPPNALGRRRRHDHVHIVDRQRRSEFGSMEAHSAIRCRWASRLFSVLCGSETNGAACGPVSATGNTVNGSVATLPPNGTATVTITATAPNGAATLTNTATVAPPAGTTDTNPGNNTSTATTIVAQLSADLSVQKTGPRNATAGSNVTYSISVTNNGPDTATNVTIADPTPAGLAFVSASAPCNTGFPCDIGSLTNGQTATISSVVFSVAPNFSGTIVNTASATQRSAGSHTEQQQFERNDSGRCGQFYDGGADRRALDVADDDRIAGRLRRACAQTSEAMMPLLSQFAVTVCRRRRAACASPHRSDLVFGNRSVVLLVGYFLEPVHHLAVECFRSTRCSVIDVVGGEAPCQCFSPAGHDRTSPGPMRLIGATPALNESGTCYHDQRLAERMRMPRVACARLERDARAGDASVLLFAGKSGSMRTELREVIGRPRRGLLRPVAIDVHINLLLANTMTMRSSSDNILNESYEEPCPQLLPPISVDANWKRKKGRTRRP